MFLRYLWEVLGKFGGTFGVSWGSDWVCWSGSAWGVFGEVFGSCLAVFGSV